MDTSVKRIFVGGLYNDISESELRDRFSKFGAIDNVEIKTKKNSDGLPENTFAYLDVNTTDENLKKCFTLLNRSRWKGKELKIQHAKADFMKRLKEERENNFEKAEKPKRKKVVFQDPLEGVAGVENFHMKGAVPGTPVDVEEKNWVVGKYGRVLPIVNIQRRDKRKIMKVDPSKFCHNSKRMKDDNMEISDVGIKNLTWKIETKDSEMIKRRKGEFPVWKQNKKKQSSDANMKLLANYYQSFTKTNTQDVSDNTDFEVVSESFQNNSKNQAYFSEDSDSDEDSTKNIKTSTPFSSTSGKPQLKAAVKTGTNHSVQHEHDNTGKEAMVLDPKCTPIMKPSGQETQNTGGRTIGNVDNSKSSSPSSQKNAVLKSVTSNISYESSSQDAGCKESVLDTNSTSTSKKSKALTQSLKSEEGQSDSKSSNKRKNNVTETKKSLSKKPKLQEFGGTRQLYENPLSQSQKKEDSPSLSSTAGPSFSSTSTAGPSSSSTSTAGPSSSSTSKAGLSSSSTSTAGPSSSSTSTAGPSSSSTSKVGASSVQASAPDEPQNEAMLGVKRSLFQNSFLKTGPEKEKEEQEDSDRESVASDDTDIIIASAKKQRGGGTVLGYGSLETPVSLQASLTSSVCSEFGGGLMDGNMSGQASWMEEQDDHDDNDSDDSDDFEKMAEKILKKNQQTNLSGSNKGLENKESIIQKHVVQNSEIDNSKESDSDNDDDNTDTSTRDGNDKSSSSNDDVKSDDTDEEEADSDNENTDEDDKSSSGVVDDDVKSDDDEVSDDENTDSSTSDEDSESNDDNIKSDKIDQEEEEESDVEESSSSDEDDPEVTTGVIKNTEILNEVQIRNGKKDQQIDNHTAGKEEDKQGKTERKNNPTTDTKESKGNSKEKVDQQKLAIEANRKKQEALRLKQQEYNARKSIIKQALSSADNTKRSNRIVFDSDSDDDTAPTSITTTSATKPPDKKPWDLEDSDEEDESEDNSSDDESDEESDEKLQTLVTSTAKKTEKISLFDESSSDDNDDDNDEDAFKNKPQFEGEAGSKLMKLQMKFSSDSRFKIDKRFAESDEEPEDEEGSKKEEEDEKTRNLKVLQEVVGVQVGVVTDKKDKLKRQFKDISALQYDPSREDHKNFEIQPTTDASQKKNKDDKKKKSKKEKSVETEIEEAEPLPVVSSEKFYEVSSTLENAFKKSADNDNQTETGGFSLLAAFGRKDEDQEDVEETHDEPTALTDKWQGLNVQNSSDEDDLSGDSDEEKETEAGEDSKKVEKAVFVSKEKTEFFFTEDDERIKEGIASFCRQENLEKIRERWQEWRVDLIKAYHAKHKRAVRNKRALEKKKAAAKRQ